MKMIISYKTRKQYAMKEKPCYHESLWDSIDLKWSYRNWIWNYKILSIRL